MKVLIVSIIVFLLFSATFGFSWNPSINTDVSISSNPTCPGHYDVIVGGITYPCFGTATDNVVTENICPNGLQGIKINNTLTCGVITEYITSGGECEFGGYRFLSNTVNTTICYNNLTNFIDSTLINSPSVVFIKTPTTISANAIISATDLTSGFASVLGGCSGANCNYRQFRGTDPTLINVQQDATTIYVTSNLKAQNLPYPNVSLSLFPDCPFATTQADINVCLAGRTLPNLANYTNARQVLYTPASPVLGQSNITVADGFDVIFIRSKPIFKRIWNVDPNNGDDVLGDGSPFAPFKTIRKTFMVIGTFLYADAQLVHLALGSYTESSLEWPPNTFVDGDTVNRVISIVVNGSITLRADWATAGPRVEGGISGVMLTTTTPFTVDFTIMGIRPPTSVARFSVTNCDLDSSFVGIGGGVTDLFHFFLSDIIAVVSLNCGNVHFERNIINGAVLVTDTLCSASALDWHFIFNYMEDDANTTISQSTSTSISADFFVNGWDGGFLAVYASIFGALTFNSFTLPLYYYISSNVVIKRNLALEASAAINLNTSYWAASEQNALQMMNTLAGRSKTATSSGLGAIPIIYSITSTNTYFNDFSSSSPAVPLSQSGGVITIGFDINADIYFPASPFRGLSVLSIQYTFDRFYADVLPSVTGFWYVDPVNGDDSFSGAPNSKLRTIGKAFDLIATFPFLQMQTVLLVPGYYTEGGLLWPPNTFVKSLGSVEDTLVVISGANVDLRSDWSTYANDIVEGGIQDVQWKCDKFIIDYAGVEGGGGGYSNSRFSFTRTVMDSYFIINGRGNFDHVDFLLTTMSQVLDTNCLNMEIQSCKITADFNMNDSPCSVSDIVVNMQGNKFYETSTFVLKHSDSTNFVITSLYNTFPTTTTTQFYGKPNLYANGLPLNLFLGPSVTLITMFSAKGVVMDNLPTPYFPTTIMNLDDIILTIASTTYLSSFTVSSVATSFSLLSSVTPTSAAIKGLLSGNSEMTITSGINDLTLTPTPTYVKLRYSNTATRTNTGSTIGTFVSVMPTTFAGSLTIAAGTFVVGSKLVFTIHGIFTIAVASTLTWRIQLNGVTAYGTSNPTASIAITANQAFQIEAELNIFTIGVSGTALGSGTLEAFTATAPIISTTAVAINTNIANTVDVQVTHSTTNVGNIVTILSAKVTHERP